MTPGGEASSQTRPNRILLRQANPLVVRNGKAQKGLFRIDTDPETGERAISVKLSVPSIRPGTLTSDTAAVGPPTMGTVGVSMNEIVQLNLRATPDPLPENPYHWLLLLPDGVSKSSIQNPLKTFAVNRGWLLRPTWNAAAAVIVSITPRSLSQGCNRSVTALSS